MALHGSGARIPKLRIANLHKSFRVNESLLKRVVGRILTFCGPSRPTEFEFIFMDDGSIKSLNKKYKGRNVPTDVLAFNIKRDEFGPKTDLGEAYISIDRALDYSRKCGADPHLETVLYVVHAILHICGYDDEKSNDRKRMWNKQEEILRHLWKQEDLSKVLMPR